MAQTISLRSVWVVRALRAVLGESKGYWGAMIVCTRLNGMGNSGEVGGMEAGDSLEGLFE